MRIYLIRLSTLYRNWRIRRLEAKVRRLQAKLRKISPSCPDAEGIRDYFNVPRPGPIAGTDAVADGPWKTDDQE